MRLEGGLIFNRAPVLPRHSACVFRVMRLDAAIRACRHWGRGCASRAIALWRAVLAAGIASRGSSLAPEAGPRPKPASFRRCRFKPLPPEHRLRYMSILVLSIAAGWQANHKDCPLSPLLATPAQPRWSACLFAGLATGWRSNCYAGVVVWVPASQRNLPPPLSAAGGRKSMRAFTPARTCDAASMCSAALRINGTDCNCPSDESGMRSSISVHPSMTASHPSRASSSTNCRKKALR
jgi:hypothetical protein